MAGDASLPLSDALARWADTALVESVRKAEQNHTHPEVCGFYQEHPALIQLSADGEMVSNFLSSGSLEVPPFATLKGAWKKLERSFRRQIADGRLSLRGAAITLNPATAPTPIPNAWAADCSFDFDRDRVAIGERVYGAVTVSCTPSVAAIINSAPHSAAPGPITAESARRLTDDEVLLLLEEHALRAIKGPDAKLIAPGKISLMPFVARKMRERAESGALLLTPRAEARYLAEWIAEKAPTHQTPKAATIEKVLRTEYGVLKQRASAAT